MPMDLKDLKICIIGAGMGGLTSALALAKEGFKDIRVFESSSGLGSVGAGIQLAPNMARILDRLGVWPDIEREAVKIKDTSIRQGSSNSELGHVNLSYIHETYGYPHMVGHRESLSKEKVDTFFPRPSFNVTHRSDDTTHRVEADIVLAADGVKSNVRSQLLSNINVAEQSKDTGQAAYRVMLTREDMKDDPELLALLDSESVIRWVGLKRHIIAYPISNNTIYNLSTVQPDTNFASAPSATYTTKGSKSAMLSVFSDFYPMAQRMLNLVPEGEVCEWKLRVHEPLPTWVHGSVALLGDACHPTLPHLAQGAAQAIEDGAVLSVVLSELPDTSPESINKALLVYENVRKNHAETIVELAAASGRALHLGDGGAKEERDRQFAALKEKKNGTVPDKWADADVQKLIYGHDCMQVARDGFEELFSRV